MRLCQATILTSLAPLLVVRGSVACPSIPAPGRAARSHRFQQRGALGTVGHSRPGYKIWQIDFRRSKPGDSGLYLHQDAPGQLNIAVLLSDNSTGDGATIFLLSTHRIARRMKDLRVEVPPRVIRLAPFLFSPLTGRAGDISFFFNRTWHGRFANRSSRSYDVILIGFFPAGAQMGFPPPYVAWSPEILALGRTDRTRPAIGSGPWHGAPRHRAVSHRARGGSHRRRPLRCPWPRARRRQCRRLSEVAGLNRAAALDDGYFPVRFPLASRRDRRPPNS